MCCSDLLLQGRIDDDSSHCSFRSTTITVPRLAYHGLFPVSDQVLEAQMDSQSCKMWDSSDGWFWLKDSHWFDKTLLRKVPDSSYSILLPSFLFRSLSLPHTVFFFFFKQESEVHWDLKSFINYSSLYWHFCQCISKWTPTGWIQRNPLQDTSQSNCENLKTKKKSEKS